MGTDFESIWPNSKPLDSEIDEAIFKTYIVTIVE